MLFSDFSSDIETFRKNTIDEKHFNESEANNVILKCKM